MYGPDAEVEYENSINLREKHPERWEKPYNQLSVSSCVANASAAAFAFELKRQNLPSLDPSRLFIYWNARTAAQRKSDDGCWTRLAMKGMDVCGVCKESDFTYPKMDDEKSMLAIQKSDEKKALQKPGQNAYKDAKHHRIVRYYRLDPDRPAAQDINLTKEQKNALGNLVLVNLRTCIAEGFPVVFGFIFYKETGFVADAEDYWTLKGLPGRHVKPDYNDPNYKVSGHAVLAIGYDHKKKRVLCQNSWGDGSRPDFKSKDGLFWIGYEWITDFEATNDFWMLRLIKEEKARL